MTRAGFEPASSATTQRTLASVAVRGLISLPSQPTRAPTGNAGREGLLAEGGFGSLERFEPFVGRFERSNQRHALAQRPLHRVRAVEAGGDEVRV
jgi:hypothetical protein